ncbi:MAG: T9SS type A sorting domain-containing protein, partial [Flavobacteriales bacterium]
GTCLERTSDFVTVNVEICTGIDARTGASWNLQPNPSNGDFTLISSITNDRVVVDVLEMGGRLAHSEQLSVIQGQAYTMHLAGQLVPGVYLLRFSTTGTSTTRRMVVQ